MRSGVMRFTMHFFFAEHFQCNAVLCMLAGHSNDRPIFRTNLIHETRKLEMTKTLSRKQASGGRAFLGKWKRRPKSE